VTVRLAVLAGAPVYYQAPLYRRVAADPRIDFTAIFASDLSAVKPDESGYARPIRWGVESLEGYRSTFLARADRNPSGGGVLALRDVDVVGRIWRGHYDVVWLHGYHTVTHVLASLAQRSRGGARLYREEQTLLTPRPVWKSALKSVGLRALFSGSYGLFIGTENRRWFEHWGVPPERLFHVPYAVDDLESQVADLRPHQRELRADFGLPLDQPVVLLLGRLIEKKEPLAVLSAFGAVSHELDASLLVVGSGPLEAAMRERVVTDGIGDVAFAGFLDRTEIARAYAAADVLVLFSSHETWGLVVNEALSVGLPVVVSDRVGCAGDLVHDGRNGFVVPHDDVAGLAAALRRLIASESTRHAFGSESRAICSTLTYDTAAEGVLTAVARAVGPERWAAANRAARHAAEIGAIA
jgi:glycosyltransferase involved in cell wall biosynthesis